MNMVGNNYWILNSLLLHQSNNNWEIRLNRRWIISSSMTLDPSDTSPLVSLIVGIPNSMASFHMTQPLRVSETRWIFKSLWNSSLGLPLPSGHPQVRCLLNKVFKNLFRFGFSFDKGLLKIDDEFEREILLGRGGFIKRLPFEFHWSDSLTTSVCTTRTETRLPWRRCTLLSLRISKSFNSQIPLQTLILVKYLRKEPS